MADYSSDAATVSSNKALKKNGYRFGGFIVVLFAVAVLDLVRE